MYGVYIAIDVYDRIGDGEKNPKESRCNYGGDPCIFLGVQKCGADGGLHGDSFIRAKSARKYAAGICDEDHDAFARYGSD